MRKVRDTPVVSRANGRADVLDVRHPHGCSSAFGVVTTGVRLLLLCLLLMPAACGYGTREIFPARYETIAVPIFENRTFYREVEFDLTEAVIKEVEQRTPYRVVATDAADTVLEGRIMVIEQDVLSQATGAVPQEVEVVIAIDFAWRDLDSGRVILDRKGFAGVGRYIPQRRVGEPFEVARRMAVEQLAGDIVDTLRGDW